MGDCYSTNHCDAHAAPALPIYTEARLAVYSQARAIVESVISAGTAASVMARPGTLCIATVTVLVILVAAVQTGIVAYLEGVPSSMGSIEPPLLKGCLRKYYAQTCARILVPPFTSSILRLGMAICYIRPLQYSFSPRYVCAPGCGRAVNIPITR